MKILKEIVVKTKEYEYFIKTEKGKQWIEKCKNYNNGQTGSFSDFLYDFYPEILM